jgi:hypothetical protein
MRAVQVSEYVKVHIPSSSYQPTNLAPNSQTNLCIGPPGPKSNRRPDPNTINRQIPNRNPLGGYKLLRHPPNPRQIPTSTTTTVDRRRRIRRHNHCPPDFSHQAPLQSRRPRLRRYTGRLRNPCPRTRAHAPPRSSRVELRRCGWVVRDCTYFLWRSCSPCWC